MISLSYLFEDAEQIAGAAKKVFTEPDSVFSLGNIKRTAGGIGKGVKNLVGKIPKDNIGGTVYNATHEPESGASYGDLLFKTKKAVDARREDAAFRIAKGAAGLKETEPERAKQWMQSIKHRKEWEY